MKICNFFEENFSSWAPCRNNIEPNCYIELIAPIQFLPLSKFFFQLNPCPPNLQYISREKAQSGPLDPLFWQWRVVEFLYRKVYRVLGPSKEFCWGVSQDKPSWLSSKGRCRKSRDCPNEDLARSSHKPDMEYKSIIILLYFWLHNENH